MPKANAAATVEHKDIEAWAAIEEAAMAIQSTTHVKAQRGLGARLC